MSALFNSNTFSKVLGNKNGLFNNLKNQPKHLANQFKMNNNPTNYTDYSDYLTNNSQYYAEKYTDLNSKSTFDLSNNLINYNFNAKLNNLPVNYYHENYSDLLNNNTLFNNSKFIANQPSKRSFHRSSVRNSTNTYNDENLTANQRLIDQKESIANKNPIQFDFALANPFIYPNWYSRDMIANSSSNDEQESQSLYNNSTLSPNSSSRQHSLVKRSSVLSSPTHINNNNNYNNDDKLPKLMPIYKDGRYYNPFDTWQQKTYWGVLKFLLSPSNINLPKDLRDLDITLPVVKPILSTVIPDDQLRVSWIGHATVLVQFENISLITDPHLSLHATPLKIGVKRYRPAPCKVGELPDNLNMVVISHNHYDHLDSDTVCKLNKKYKTQLNWFVPLGMKAWFTSMGITQNVNEMNWWQEINLNDDVKVVALPSQHWSRRGAFDENKELWCSYAVIGRDFRFYFAGDTGYNDTLFQSIGQYYGPFNLAAIPIGAYEPKEFLKYQHVSPIEAVKIHNDVRSNLSLSIHWGTFALSYEPYLDPPKQLFTSLDEQQIPRDRFLVFEHGETRLVDLNGTSKRENTNRYAK